MIIPVILSGGSGSRLWPLSRKSRPKQFLHLSGTSDTMLQSTVKRGQLVSSDAPIIVSSETHRFLAAEQLREINVSDAAIILEPVARNTAPAICLAALVAMEKDRNAVLLVMPADHFIPDHDKCAKYLKTGIEAARSDKIVCFGITPTAPETGYGYIKADKGNVQTIAPIYPIKEFTEKPSQTNAKKLIESGDHYWNSGIFSFKASVFINELEKFEPEIVPICRESLKHSQSDLDFTRIDAQSFSTAKDISVDYALMEKTDKAVIVPMDIDWSDVGSWGALWHLGNKDSQQNVGIGDILLDHVTNSYIHSSSRLVSVVGLDDVVVVETKDAVLVAAKDKVQNVRNIVTQLGQLDRNEHLLHREVYRPWGKYDSIDSGDRYQVKRITVNPGEKLSVQMHHHRSEHWVVVKGTAKVTKGEETFLVGENQSTYIPLGYIHALENPGKVPLELIEVQSGTYLGEDDIVRLEDRYGRSPDEI